MFLDSASRRATVGLILLAGGLALSACSTTSTATSSSPFPVSDMQDLEVGQSLGDVLTPHDSVNPRNGAPYRTYKVDLERGDTLRIAVESSEFSPGISIFAPDGTLVGATSLEGYGDTRSSLIRRAPRSGSHTVVVSGVSNRDFGAFEIRTETLTAADELSYPGEVKNFLFDNARSHPTTGAPMNVYPLAFDDDTVLDLVMESPDFNGHISLVDASTQRILTESSNHEGSSRARILAELPAGSYEIWTTASHRGPDGRYSLRVEEGAIDRTENFAIGQRYNGFLSWNRSSVPSTMRTGDPVTFEIEEPKIVTITMRSSDFDAYLVLSDESGRLLTEDDDSGGGHDSRITYQLDPGSYTLWASSYAEEENGTYSLESELLEADDRDSVELDSSFDSVLLQSAELHVSRRTPVQYYTLEIEEETEVVIDLRSSDFDTYLVLENDARTQLDENDDAEYGTDSQIIRTLAPGTYRVGVTSYAPDTFGSFTLSVRPAAPSGQRVELTH